MVQDLYFAKEPKIPEEKEITNILGKFVRGVRTHNDKLLRSLFAEHALIQSAAIYRQKLIKMDTYLDEVKKIFHKIVMYNFFDISIEVKRIEGDFCATVSCFIHWVIIRQGLPSAPGGANYTINFIKERSQH